MPNENYLLEVDGWHSLRDDHVVGTSSPPSSTTQFGFHIFGSNNSYTQGSNESTATCTTRLVGDYGSFDHAKIFYTSGSYTLPSTFSATFEGHGPWTTSVVCFNWSPGTIADGSHDSVLTSYANSIPAGQRVILTKNEVNYPLAAGSLNITTYRTDMDHMYDLIHSLTLTGRCEVWDCFGEFCIDPASGPNWSDSWINANKRDGIVWDCYWNQTTDVSGATKLGYIQAKNAHLGITAWILGETGDRRPVDGNTPSGNLGDNNPQPSDTVRANTWTNRLNTLQSANPAPQSVIYFNEVGTSGDHRIYTGTSGGGGPDVLTKAVFAAFAASR